MCYRLEKLEEQIHIGAREQRRRKNKIGKFKKETGGWVEEEEEKRSFISNYFTNLFRSAGSHVAYRLLNCVAPKVSHK